MDTRPAWRRTWDWADAWRRTTSFWLLSIGIGVAAAVWVLIDSGDWDAAAAALFLGALATFLLGFLLRWATTPLRDIGEARAALAQPSVDDASVEKRRRFDAYLDTQLERLRDQAGAIESAGSQINARTRWREFMRISWQATTGLSLFDDGIGEYLTPTLTEAERDAGDQMSKFVVVRLSSRVIDAFEDCRHLFTA